MIDGATIAAGSLARPRNSDCFQGRLLVAINLRRQSGLNTTREKWLLANRGYSAAGPVCGQSIPATSNRRTGSANTARYASFGCRGVVRGPFVPRRYLSVHGGGESLGGLGPRYDHRFATEKLHIRTFRYPRQARNALRRSINRENRGLSIERGRRK
jgi:hypothetical protein